MLCFFSSVFCMLWLVMCFLCFWGNRQLFLTHLCLNVSQILHFLIAFGIVCLQVCSIWLVLEDHFILYPLSADLRVQKQGRVFLDYWVEDEYFIVLAYFYIWMITHPQNAFRWVGRRQRRSSVPSKNKIFHHKDGSCGVKLLEVIKLRIKGPLYSVCLSFLLLPCDPNHQKDTSQPSEDTQTSSSHLGTFTGSNQSHQHVFGLGGNQSNWRNLAKTTCRIKAANPEPSRNKVTEWQQTLLSKGFIEPSMKKPTLPRLCNSLTTRQPGGKQTRDQMSDRAHSARFTSSLFGKGTFPISFPSLRLPNQMHVF